MGLGALQITGGIDNVFGSGGGSKLLAVAVIGFLTLCFVISAVSGIEKGVKYLSNANAVAAGLLVLFIFVVGPTVFILDTLREFPLSGMTVALAIFLIAIFFVTGADSASIVMGMLSQHGQEEPHRWLVVIWGVAMGAVAAVLLWSGGLEGLADPRDHRRRSVHVAADHHVRLAAEGAPGGTSGIHPCCARPQVAR